VYQLWLHFLNPMLLDRPANRHPIALLGLPPVLALAFEIRRPSEDREIRNMIPQMNAGTPL
jgi:hypothetical protein